MPDENISPDNSNASVGCDCPNCGGCDIWFCWPCAKYDKDLASEGITGTVQTVPETVTLFTKTSCLMKYIYIWWTCGTMLWYRLSLTDTNTEIVNYVLLTVYFPSLQGLLTDIIQSVSELSVTFSTYM